MVEEVRVLKKKKREWIMKKKIIAVILMMCMVNIVACGNKESNQQANSGNQLSMEEQEKVESESASVETDSNMQNNSVAGEGQIATYGGAVLNIVDLEHQDDNAESVVYYTSDISPESLMAVYESLGVELTGENIAVKVHTGESEQSNHLRPDFIKELVQHVDGTIVESNTAYGGSRAETAMHYQLAKDHGFTEIADVVIMDEKGSMSLPVEGGSILKENLVGARFGEFDGMLVLSHFKGHMLGGFGGSIKNISIGIASTEGKCLIHTGGASNTSPWGGESPVFMDSMAEAGKSVVDALSGNILFINVMNNLSIDCDCTARPSEADIHDIGILASTDPVALDQACVDLIYISEGSQSMIDRIEGVGGEDTLEHGEEIGLGNRAYNLVVMDE